MVVSSNRMAQQRAQKDPSALAVGVHDPSHPSVVGEDRGAPRRPVGLHVEAGPHCMALVCARSFQKRRKYLFLAEAQTLVFCPETLPHGRRHPRQIGDAIFIHAAWTGLGDERSPGRYVVSQRLG